MNLENFFKFIMEIIKNLQHLSFEQRWKAISIFCVPGILLVLITWQLSEAVHFGLTDDGIEVVTLKTKLNSEDSLIDNNDSNSTLWIAYPTVQQWKITWESNNPDIYSSLSQHQFFLNKERIKYNNNHLELSLPFFGVNTPAYFYSSDVDSVKYYIPGKNVIQSASIKESRSSSYALFYIMMISFFGIGIGFYINIETNKERCS